MHKLISIFTQSRATRSRRRAIILALLKQGKLDIETTGA